MAARQNAQLLDRAMLSQEERVKVLALASLLPTSLPLTYDTAHLDPTALSTDRGNTRIAILTLSTFLLFYRSQEHLHAAQQAGEEEIDTTYTHGLVRIADDFRWYPEVANRNFDFGRPLHHYYLFTVGGLVGSDDTQGRVRLRLRLPRSLTAGQRALDHLVFINGILRTDLNQANPVTFLEVSEVVNHSGDFVSLDHFPTSGTRLILQPVRLDNEINTPPYFNLYARIEFDNSQQVQVHLGEGQAHVAPHLSYLPGVQFSTEDKNNEGYILVGAYYAFIAHRDTYDDLAWQLMTFKYN